MSKVQAVSKQEKLAAQTDRVYSVINVKEFDEEKREFVGIASTPGTDRMNDVVEPKGAQYQLPIPLLWQHDRMLPVGTIFSVKMTSAGIEVRGRVAKVDSPPGLAARLDEAWESLKNQLVRGLSIGFAPIEYSFMDNGGIHFTKWDWLELSLVTIPANAQANITSIKSFDRKSLAALGTKHSVVRINTADASAATPKPKTLPKPQEGQHMNIEEQIKGFEATRTEKANRMTEIMEKAAEEGISLNAEQSEEYDTLESEIKSVDDHLKRLRSMKSMQAEQAKAATPVEDRSKMAARVPATAKVTEKLEKGIEFARYAMCQLAAKGNSELALKLAKNHYPQNDRIVKALEFQNDRGGFAPFLKANVEAGTTLDATWAAPLVDYQNFAGDFVEFLRPQTIVGQFGTGSIPSLNRIPFNVRITGQTSGGTAYWVGEGAPKPLTSFDFTATELRWNKIATIAVLTEETIRFSNPSAERLVRDALAAAVIERMDLDFIDPAKAAASNVSPASITNGATAIPSSGSDAESIRADLQALWAPFIAARNAPRTAVYLMDSTTALALSLMQNALGQPEFPGITMNGGMFNGVPVIVSDYLPVDTDGGIVVLVNARDIWLADDGQVTIDASREASLQMLDNPTNNSATATATSMVSMFQTNSVAFRAERYVNWARRRASGVAYLTGVSWGQ